MKKFLIILLPIIGCDSIFENARDAVNDPCLGAEAVGYSFEACADIEEECYGAYTLPPTPNPENEIKCCCMEDD